MAATDSATHRQLAYIKELAYSRGVSFIPPANRVEASQLIDQLKRRRPDSVADQRREIRAVKDDMASRRGDAARVIEGVETQGHLSSASWKGGRP